MLLRQPARCFGKRRSVSRLGMGGLLLLVAALAVTFPLGALAKSSPSSALGLGGPAAPEGVLGPLVPNSWASGAVYPSTITRYAYAQSGQDLYVLGGVSDGTAVATANRYNATTNIWASIAPVPVATEAPAAALLNGKIYLAEGLSGDSFNIYDIATNTWSAGAPRPGYANNYGAAAGAFGGSVYVVGGGLRCDRHDVDLHRCHEQLDHWPSRAGAVLPRGLYDRWPVPLRRRRLQPVEPDGERRCDHAARHGDRDLVARADVHARASRRGARCLR